MLKDLFKDKNETKLNEAKALVSAMASEYAQTYRIDNYTMRRRKLNLLIISISIDCDLNMDKKGKVTGTLTYKPSIKQLDELASTVDTLVNIEAQITQPSGGGTNLMVPKPLITELARNEKSINKIWNHLTGADYNLIDRNIGCSDIINIAAVGDIIRQKVAMRNAIIIGGIVLVAAAGAGTGLYLMNKNKSKNADTNVESEMPEAVDKESNDDDANIVDLGDDIVDLGDDIVDLGDDIVDLGSDVIDLSI